MDVIFPTVRLSSYVNKRQIFELDLRCRQFEVDPTVGSNITSVLLKSGPSDAQKEAVEVFY